MEKLRIENNEAALGMLIARMLTHELGIDDVRISIDMAYTDRHGARRNVTIARTEERPIPGDEGTNAMYVIVNREEALRDLLLALLPSFEIAFTNVDGMQPGEDYRRVDVACGGGDDE